MKAEFYFDKRKYTCTLFEADSFKELRIKNPEGLVLAVQQGQKVGLLGKRREEARQIDVSQPRYYNLIKAAVNALELESKNQLLLEQKQIIADKEQRIHQKEKQIESLNQQIDILKDKLEYLSTEQQQTLQSLQLENQKLEAEIQQEKEHSDRLKIQLSNSAKLTSENIREELKEKLGEAIWNGLEQASLKELCDAYRYYKIIDSDSSTPLTTDYSSAGILLGLIAEREIMSPFFKDLYRFLLKNPNPSNQISARNFEVGGVTLKSKASYTLGNLPALLSVQWDVYHNEALEEENHPETDRLYYTVFFGNNVSESDRKLVYQFLQQWKHPLSKWLLQGEKAASIVDQIRQLRNRAAHHESILYLWQFKRLWLQMIGGKNVSGILREIYHQNANE